MAARDVRKRKLKIADMMASARSNDPQSSARSESDTVKLSEFLVLFVIKDFSCVSYVR